MNNDVLIDDTQRSAAAAGNDVPLCYGLPFVGRRALRRGELAEVRRAYRHHAAVFAACILWLPVLVLITALLCSDRDRLPLFAFSSPLEVFIIAAVLISTDNPLGKAIAFRRACRAGSVGRYKGRFRPMPPHKENYCRSERRWILGGSDATQTHSQGVLTGTRRMWSADDRRRSDWEQVYPAAFTPGRETLFTKIYGEIQMLEWPEINWSLIWPSEAGNRLGRIGILMTLWLCNLHWLSLRLAPLALIAVWIVEYIGADIYVRRAVAAARRRRAAEAAAEAEADSAAPFPPAPGDAPGEE